MFFVNNFLQQRCLHVCLEDIFWFWKLIRNYAFYADWLFPFEWRKCANFVHLWFQNGFLYLDVQNIIRKGIPGSMSWSSYLNCWDCRRQLIANTCILVMFQKTPMSRFLLGYCGAVTSAVGIAVCTSTRFE